MVSRIPPASPAAIMFVNRASNTFGCFLMASASDNPPSTSLRVSMITRAKFLSSSWLPRMSRHCTSGRPASIMTENCRVNTARFLELTRRPLARFVTAFCSALVLAGAIFVTRTWSLRNATVAASSVSAMRSPLTVSPPRVRPVYAKVAMVVPLDRQNADPTVLRRRSRKRLPLQRRPSRLVARGARRPAEPGAGHHTDAPVDHIHEFVPVGGGAQRRVHRDQPVEEQRRQRLVQRLHPHPLLARLHRGVDLVDLVLADQVPDRGGRHQDLGGDDSARLTRARKQRLE